MTKTDRMLLIEERAGKDVRTVLNEALEATGALQRASDWINQEYGVQVSFGQISDWIEDGKGIVRKTIHWPDFEPVTDADPISATPAQAA